MVNSVAGAPPAICTDFAPLPNAESSAAMADAAEAGGRLFDALLFSMILLAWATVLWCWLSHYPTMLV